MRFDVYDAQGWGEKSKFLQKLFSAQTGHRLREKGRTMKMIPKTIRRGWEPVDEFFRTKKNPQPVPVAGVGRVINPRSMIRLSVRFMRPFRINDDVPRFVVGNASWGRCRGHRVTMTAGVVFPTIAGYVCNRIHTRDRIFCTIG